MARLRFKGQSSVQLPTPFGFLVNHGDVVEIPEHLLGALRQPSVSSMFAVTQTGSVRMPAFDDWEDAELNPPEPETEQEAHTARRRRHEGDDAG